MKHLVSILWLCLLTTILTACDNTEVSDTAASEIPSSDTTSNENTGNPPPPANEPPPQASCVPSAAEQLMLNLVNAARAQPRQCGDQAFAATQALQWNCQLADAADSHSRDMATNNFFNHTGSDGLRVSNRVTAAGYQWRFVGENIAAGHQTEEIVVQAWLESPGHCANIMNPNYEDFGSAVILTDQADYPSYWTQVFAAPR